MATLTVGLGGTFNFSTIQAAVDAAGNGDTIDIAAGTYREQVTVDGKDITIHGAGSGLTIIESPDASSLVANAIDTNSGRPNKFAVITVTDNADVTIEGLTVDGREQGAVPASNYVTGSNHDFLGIYVLNSDAVIDGVAVANIDELVGAGVSGNQRNHAIIATSHDIAHGGTGAHTVTIENSDISNFQKTGIFANGATLTVDIHDTTITGTQTAGQAQNAIQIGSSGAFAGTNATIDHNTITDIGYNDPTTTNPFAGGATGILVFHGGSIEVTDNTVSGYAPFSTNPNYQNNGILLLDTDGGVVQDNTISAFDVGLGDYNSSNGPETTVLSHSGNVYTNDAANIVLFPQTAGTTPITFSASEGNDQLFGTAAADTLSGLGGNDYIDAGAGNDTLSGGADNDTLVGGTGSDTVSGGAGTDTAVYADGLANYTYTPSTDANGFVTGFTQVTETTVVGLDEGSDSLTGVEQLVFQNGTPGVSGDDIALDLTQAAQLFDASNNLIGTFDDLKSAVDAANSHAGTTFTIRLAAGNVDIGGAQVAISKNITIDGAGMGATTLHADFNTGGNHNADSAGLILVNAGVTANFSDLKIDGTGQQVTQAIRHLGIGTVEHVHFANIEYTTYVGTGISVRGNGDVDVLNSTFTNIERIGAHFRDAGVTGKFEGNTYTGKGAGDWIEYAAEAGGGAVLEVLNNTVTGNLGVALSDGSTSAAFLVTTYFGLGTHATFGGNVVTDSTAGVAAGYPGPGGVTGVEDRSNVTFLAGNDFSDAITGVEVVGDVTATGTSLVNGTFDWDGGAGNNAPSGSFLADVLRGGAGNDTLSGGANNDTLVGGSGIDTAAYTATINTDGITDDGASHFVVVSGGSEGTDTLSGIEKIDGAGTPNILLVGNGGYASIQAAVDAAIDGDIIEVAAGTWTGDVAIHGKAITIDGVETGGVNNVTINGQITVDGTLNGAFKLTDLNINATGKAYGVFVSAASIGFAGSVTLDDVSVAHARSNGFAYIRAGNEFELRLTPTRSARCRSSTARSATTRP